jgi:hypothetical protein
VSALRPHRLPAWLALVALVFSAISPALAAALFAERPEISARILGIAVTAPATDTADCHDDAEGTPQRHEQHDDHASHGTFCSWCLVASSLLALPAVAVDHAAPNGHAFAASHGADVRLVARCGIGYQPRAPPLSRG